MSDSAGWMRERETRLTALCPGLPGSAGTRKVKPIWILLKQETVSGGGISWATCKSAPHSRQITTPAPHHSFLQAGCPSCRPTNSVKALKAGWMTRRIFILYTSCGRKHMRDQHVSVNGRLSLPRICHR